MMYYIIKLRVLVSWILQTMLSIFNNISYVSQCPINSKETFIYRFKVERVNLNPKTYFYHGHFGIQ
uniref:Plastocyanin-like domain-containing protein n=1 Tax=Physcomitrium patens TaxID=3218 RepID=A0A2K1J0U9_PHYPA|nr:hypothetical protein PHYPA_023054 [Physcomitrium patens]